MACLAIDIRPARITDMDAMVGLLEALFSIEKDFVFNAARHRAGLELLLRSSSASVLVADMDGEAVGMCTGQLVVSTVEGGDAALVEDMIVREDVRGRGLGRQLLDAVTEWAHGHGAHRLQLLADVDNIPALGFYKHAGWRSTALICLRKTQSTGAEQ